MNRRLLWLKDRCKPGGWRPRREVQFVPRGRWPLRHVGLEKYKASMAAMEALKSVYLSKCKDFACEPVQAFLDDLDSTQGQANLHPSPMYHLHRTSIPVTQRTYGCRDVLADLRLAGSSKRMFNNRLDTMQVFALCETLADDTNIMAMDLSHNFLTDMATQALASIIKSNRTIRFINLAGNDIGPEGAQHLAKALSHPSCSLQAMSLTGNPLEEDGCMAMADMLRVNTSLRALDLNNVGAGVKGLVSVCSALTPDAVEPQGQANTSLEVLDLGQPVIHQPQDTVVLAISRMLAGNPTLFELGLSKQRLVDSQLETLVRGCLQPQGLVIVSYGRMCLASDVQACLGLMLLPQVSYGLLHNQVLTSIDLRANRLSGFSGPQLERLLTENTHISALNLASNMLGDAGACSLARCLPYCTWLTRLDLRNNNIGEQGLVALADALSLAGHLQLLLLWGNVFGPASSRAFLEALGSDGHKARRLRQGLVEQLVIDVRPYEVDGVAQVAHLDTSEAEEAL
ncbi:hypothetical protein QJQ45_026712 [Haematococcus lacustris]|nr:hypothetical protein QJQ45_026712 [Haematococcus lacustris]